MKAISYLLKSEYRLFYKLFIDAFIDSLSTLNRQYKNDC